MAARKAPEDRRAELLRAAVAVIARRGFAAVTLRDVAAEAGVAHGLLRHYFRSREELLAAAFDLAANEDAAQLPASPTSPAAHLLDRCEPLPDQHYLLWIDAWSEAPRSPELAAILRRHHSSCERVAEGAVREGNARGLWSCPDPAAAATAFEAQLDGLAVQLYALHRIDRDGYARLARTAVEGLLGLARGGLAAAADRERVPAP
jgi:AcrR family transcriptional regulator